LEKLGISWLGIMKSWGCWDRWEIKKLFGTVRNSGIFW
jgi:hypothetical protein